MKRAILVPILAVALLAVAGCKDPYGACVKADSDIAQGIASGLSTVSQLNAQGVLSNTEALNVAGYLEFANQADEAFGNCVEAAHTSSKAGAFTACAQTFNTSLNNPTELTLIHVSNPQGSANVSIMVNGITTGVSAIITALGGK